MKPSAKQQQKQQLKQQRKLLKQLLTAAAVLCAVSVAVMLYVLSTPKTVMGEFVPPPFESISPSARETLSQFILDAPGRVWRSDL